jgi:hypothetical protein
VLFFSNCCKWLSLCELLNCHVDYNWVLWCLLNKQTNWWNSQHCLIHCAWIFQRWIYHELITLSTRIIFRVWLNWLILACLLV